MTETKKTYEFAAQWFNTAEELESMFGPEFTALRNKQIEAYRESVRYWDQMNELANTVVSAKVEIPAGTHLKLVRTQRGSIGLTLERDADKKAPKAPSKPKLSVTDKLAAFGTPKLYTKSDNGRAVEKADENKLPADFDRRKQNTKPNASQKPIAAR